MKINVHEIEGNHYCAIDDITRVKARHLSASLSSKDEAIEIFQNYRLFVHITEMIDELTTPLQLLHIRQSYPHLLDGDKLYNQQLFRCSDKSYLFHTLSNGIYQVKAINKDHDHSIKITKIITTNYPDAEIWALYRFKAVNAVEDFMHTSKVTDYYDAELENELYSATTAITKETTSGLYAELNDTKTYLAPFLNDEDYILPDNISDVYLPILEASKYIERETGLNFTLYDIVDFAYQGLIRLYLPGIWAKENGYRLIAPSDFVMGDFLIAKAKEFEAMSNGDEESIINIFDDIMYYALCNKEHSISDAYYPINLGSRIQASNEYIGVFTVTDVGMARFIKMRINPYWGGVEKRYENKLRGEVEKWIYNNIENYDIHCVIYKELEIEMTKRGERPNPKGKLHFMPSTSTYLSLSDVKAFIKRFNMSKIKQPIPTPKTEPINEAPQAEIAEQPTTEITSLTDEPATLKAKPIAEQKSPPKSIPVGALWTIQERKTDPLTNFYLLAEKKATDGKITLADLQGIKLEDGATPAKKKTLKRHLEKAKKLFIDNSGQ